MSQTRREQRAEAAKARRDARDGGAPKPAQQKEAVPGRIVSSPTTARAARSLRYRATEDRPPGLFGNWPVTELIIVVGVFIFIVGFSKGPSHGGQPKILAGIGLCAIGVFEFTIREHLAGYRSHALLLAGAPVVVLHGIVVLIAPKGSAFLYVVLVPDVIVYALCFQVLRGAYKRAEIKRELAGTQAKGKQT